MIKLLHTADWHLCSPLQGHGPELRERLLAIPGQIAALCREENCQLLLVCGDIFDGPATGEAISAVKAALETAGVPVFISPGNHDFVTADSPWLTQRWPENVHIFTRPVMESVYVESLDCRVYGAGYSSMDCAPLLQDFHASADQLSIGVLHGDPTATASPYCPITQSQIAGSGLAYLALGHIHKGGQLKAGNTLCAWPGCPVGRGYDEEGEKGVLIATVGEEVTTRFLPLGGPNFYDWECSPEALDALLPPVGNDHYYRITLTGESQPLDLAALRHSYARFPNLVLRNRTVPPVDIWKSLGDDSFEGTYFGLLHGALAAADAQEADTITLAAKLCRQLLDGQEVVLP